MSLDETGKLKAQWLPRQPKYLNRSEREQYQAGRAAFLGQLPKVGETGDRAATMKSHVGLPRPRNTPAEIIDNLNKAINAGLTDPKIMARLFDLGNAVFAGSPPTSQSSSPARQRSGPT